MESKKSEDYLSESAKKLLSNPQRAREFLKTWVEGGQESLLSFADKNYEINNKTDFSKIPDDAVIWIAKTQAGFEIWMEQNGMTPVQSDKL